MGASWKPLTHPKDVPNENPRGVTHLPQDQPAQLCSLVVEALAAIAHLLGI
jgi:hypothetical protein